MVNLLIVLSTALHEFTKHCNYDDLCKEMTCNNNGLVVGVVVAELTIMDTCMHVV